MSVFCTAWDLYTVSPAFTYKCIHFQYRASTGIHSENISTVNTFFLKLLIENCEVSMKLPHKMTDIRYQPVCACSLNIFSICFLQRDRQNSSYHIIYLHSTSDIEQSEFSFFFLFSLVCVAVCF